MNHVMKDMDAALDALSPLDGRYVEETAPLAVYWSERALLGMRVRVEIEYLLALSRRTGLVRAVSVEEERRLRELIDLSPEGARRIKELERTTRHDVKAIEYWMREQLSATSLSDLCEWIHFGLTSEDTNQTAQALALRETRDQVLLPAWEGIITQLTTLARRHRNLPMLARTHGQAAVPTTFGKELAVFVARLRHQRDALRAHQFQAKLSGAVGNWNALQAAAPDVDWVGFSQAFIRSFGLEPNIATTQLMPFDNWIEFLDIVRLDHSILLGLVQDLWRYISDDYVVLATVANEVGSSTMPQKVNPIDLENAEGNLGLANALLVHMSQKLPISRLQRDLSDSTVRRNFGVAFGYGLVAVQSLARALERIDANPERMRADLEGHWQVVTEGAQVILRAAGYAHAYEELKQLARGRSLDRAAYAAWVDGLRVNDSVKEALRGLTPLSYIGLAAELTDRALGDNP